MRIGDKVRFLSETGGGRITAFKPKNIVMVEDEDGFEIPMLANEVVVVGEDDYDIAKVHTDAVPKQKTTSPQVEPEVEPADRSVTFRPPVEERKGGDQLSAYLAFVPLNSREMTHTRFETYVVNDSNYYLSYIYMTAEGANWTLRSQGEIEPNTKLFVEEFGRETLNELEHVCVQVVAYKRDKSFRLKPAIEVQFRIDPVKFYKLHTFRENEFFESPAMLFTIVENDQTPRPLVVDAKKLKEELYRKNGVEKRDNTYVRRYEDGRQGNPFVVRKHKGQDAPVVVDLHAHELLETTAGMSASDILNYQLDVFRKTIEQNRSQKGTKIVFIHGKGEGVLRQAIIHELNYRYKQYPYQDASFQEYGYGATQITIK